MRLDGRDLSIQNQGEDVGLLHDELSFLGFHVPQNERADMRFDSATEDAVMKFQETQNIERTGVVDQRTRFL